MNKLAGKELQSLPSQINAGYSEGAAATDPLSASLHAFISAQSHFKSTSKGKSKEGSWERGVTAAAAVWEQSPARLYGCQGYSQSSKNLVLLWDRSYRAGSAGAKEAYTWLRWVTKTLIQFSVHLF